MCRGAPIAKLIDFRGSSIGFMLLVDISVGSLVWPLVLKDFDEDQSIQRSQRSPKCDGH